eukprot:2418955-Alexandrium_andersonii.AAC.1
MLFTQLLSAGTIRGTTSVQQHRTLPKMLETGSFRFLQFPAVSCAASSVGLQPPGRPKKVPPARAGGAS